MTTLFYVWAIILLSPLPTSPQYLPVDDNDKGGSCSELTIPGLCDNVGYTNIYLPNFRGHATQGEAAGELDDFVDLLNSGCSPVLRQFMCAYYLPFCGQSPTTGELFRIRPCRSLCEQARSNCSEILAQNSNFTWPVFLNCSLDTFPCGGESCFGISLPCEPVMTTDQPTTSSVSTTFAASASTREPSPSTDGAMKVVSSSNFFALLLLIWCVLLVG